MKSIWMGHPSYALWWNSKQWKTETGDSKQISRVFIPSSWIAPDQLKENNHKSLAKEQKERNNMCSSWLSTLWDLCVCSRKWRWGRGEPLHHSYYKVLLNLLRVMIITLHLLGKCTLIPMKLHFIRAAETGLWAVTNMLHQVHQVESYIAENKLNRS